MKQSSRLYSCLSAPVGELSSSCGNLFYLNSHCTCWRVVEDRYVPPPCEPLLILRDSQKPSCSGGNLLRSGISSSLNSGMLSQVFESGKTVYTIFSINQSSTHTLKVVVDVLPELFPLRLLASKIAGFSSSLCVHEIFQLDGNTQYFVWF